jgi:hypothetical protein
VLANYADTLQQQIAKAFYQKNKLQFKYLTNKFIILLDDNDALLHTKKDYLLCKWINSAKKMGTNYREEKLYERNARNLITTCTFFRTSFETDSIRVRPYFDERLENTGLFAVSVEQLSNKIAQKPVKWAF